MGEKNCKIGKTYYIVNIINNFLRYDTEEFLTLKNGVTICVY